MELSRNGLEFIKNWEGCTLKVIRDIGGVKTVGYGHTGTDVNTLKVGDTITEAQAEKFLLSDINTVLERVTFYDRIYGFNQNQFDALVSFCFNVGNITQLTANGTRDINVIPHKMLLYCKVNGKTVKGLQNRRAAERELYLKPAPIYYPRLEIETESIIDALKSIGAESSKESRARIASRNGVPDYRGTKEQNVYLLELFRAGKLVR